MPLLIKCMLACSVSSVVSLCDPLDFSPQGSSVHGILQARILEWVARGSSPRDLLNPGITPKSPVSLALQVDSLPTESPGKPSESI